MRDSDMICQELWSVQKIQKSKDCRSNFVENRCNFDSKREASGLGAPRIAFNEQGEEAGFESRKLHRLFLCDSSFDSRNLWPSRRKVMGQAIQGFKALRSDITHYSQICQAGRGREKFRWHHVQYDRIWYKVYININEIMILYVTFYI